MSTDTQLDDLLTVRTFATRYPELGTESAIRWNIFNAASNGLEGAGAIVRRGRKILIDVPRFREWILRDRVIEENRPSTQI